MFYASDAPRRDMNERGVGTEPTLRIGELCRHESRNC